MADSLRQDEEVPSTPATNGLDDEKMGAIRDRFSRQDAAEVSQGDLWRDKEAVNLNDILSQESNAASKVATFYQTAAVTAQMAKLQIWFQRRAVKREGETQATDRGSPAVEQTCQLEHEGEIGDQTMIDGDTPLDFNPHNEVDRGSDEDVMKQDWTEHGIRPSRGDCGHCQRDGLDRLSSGPRKVPEGLRGKKDDEEEKQGRDNNEGSGTDRRSSGDGGDEGGGRRNRDIQRNFQFDSRRYIRTLNAFPSVSLGLVDAEAVITRKIQAAKRADYLEIMAAIEDTVCAILPIPESQQLYQQSKTNEEHMRDVERYRAEQKKHLEDDPEAAQLKYNFLARQLLWTEREANIISCSNDCCQQERRTKAEKYFVGEGGKKRLLLPAETPPGLPHLKEMNCSSFDCEAQRHAKSEEHDKQEHALKQLKLPETLPPELAPLQMAGRWRKFRPAGSPSRRRAVPYRTVRLFHRSFTNVTF